MKSENQPQALEFKGLAVDFSELKCMGRKNRDFNCFEGLSVAKQKKYGAK